MNFGEKVGPLVAELLSGFTLLLLASFTLGQRLNPLLHEDAAVILATFALIAWLLGTFIDAFRNFVIESIWDRFPKYELKWQFLLQGEPEAVKNLEQYFLSFYRIDVDMAIAVLLYLIAGPRILSVITDQAVPYYSCGKGILLAIVVIIFILDAFSLRREMHKYIP